MTGFALVASDVATVALFIAAIKLTQANSVALVEVLAAQS